MYDWKQRLIAYIESFDAADSFEKVKPDIIQELGEIGSAIKNEERKEDTRNDAGISNMKDADSSGSSISIEELIQLFRSLFYGRQDVFAVQWENKKTGKYGYAPKCVNEWNRKLCGKT